jgi:predicted enzyme related to lactoylglutathione lyase
MSNADIRGRFVWHELMTTDTDAAAAFYSKVVPWKTQDSGMPSYTLWMAGKTQVGGLTGLPADGDASAPPHWIVYVATPDVDATVAAAERLGGKVLKGATDIPNMGRYAVLTDPQGATFAVYTPPGPPPEGADASGGPGEFAWHELATTDQDAALAFYTELFGWEKGPAHDMGNMTYQLVLHNGAQVGGIYALEAPASPPHWLSYVRVPDCTKATNAAKAAGGRVLNGPMEVPGGSWITMMIDPQGGAFAVLEAPRAAASKPAAAKRSSGKAKATAKADAAPKAEAEVSTGTAAPARAKAAAKKAPVKATARKAPKKAAAKAGGRKAVAKAKSGAGKKTAKKAAKKAAGKRPVKSTSAKRGKSAAKKSKRPAKKAKRR